MNLQAPIAGQYSRQVSNQGGASLPAIPQQQNMMQNSEGGPRAPVTMEQARQFIRDRIYKFLTQRLTREMPPKNYLDIVRRLEEGLFKSAQSKEEYLNLDTLENRLQALLKRNSMNNQNQRYQQQSNANASMGTMIPTPGFPQNGNSGNMMSSVVNQGSFSMTTPGPSRSMHTGSFDGGLSDGSQ
ncbi:putative histone acetyltransferase [Helianthus annuus]|nr:histone acetyltransferase HAC1 [Helianthus annuus]XP_022038695.1 histone acetyltransferase HAC1 [Helianthus annuus]KAF5806421.1 putative histone acetyltransferase [Helianthus annuus]KAJ0570692.1 putative histone acetyltransferase [Helianthus annuus]KAJ0577610.1 putative histone acetyltransferase [Helianthus annuus]KAJ0585035.1 putative histone acetyltransferase [Helianthus annuus]KAJ0747596.1 putative histone acetyltransferase [Helianthus annuus]